MQTVTRTDIILPQFRDITDPETQLEFREDGEVVRKDRWEVGLRTIAQLFGFRAFEVPDVVKAVKASQELNTRALAHMVSQRRAETDIDVRMGSWIAASLSDETACREYKACAEAWLAQFHDPIGQAIEDSEDK